jgi:DNA N-6-adenine-methyltransferase (Dam)
MTAANLLSLTNERYTPLPLIESAERVLGSIELDPASCEAANSNVGAERYYTIADDSLSKLWQAKTVFLNPPGSVVNGRSQTAAFWDKLYRSFLCKSVSEAIFIGFNSQIISKCPTMFNFPICFTHREATSPLVNGQGRFCYLDKNMNVLGQPTQSSIFVYLSWNLDKVDLFRDEFTQYGRVIFDAFQD